MLSWRTALLFSLVMLVALPSLAERPAAHGPSTSGDKQLAWETHLQLKQQSPTRALLWRSVGPVVQGGRLVDIEVVPDEPYTFYVAFASGGLWRTTNNGVSFQPLFDDQPTLIMGDIALDPQDPKTIWVGTGENNSSRSSYGGHGVFRSDDAGESWQSVGLIDTDRIGRILVDPRDSNRVYVAALGRLYGPGGERGVYRSLDRGESFQKILPGDENTGFIDLVFDPADPDVIYAASWERTRRPWDLTESGPGSALWKSADGGDHWTRLEGGFPSGEHVGRIGLTICSSQPKTLYAFLDNQEPLPESMWDLGDGAVTAKRLQTMTRQELLEQDPEEIEAFLRGHDFHPELDAEIFLEKIRSGEITIEDLIKTLSDANASLFTTDIRGPEIWRSDDAGESWRRTHDQPLRQVSYTYGYYFGQVRVAPDDPDRLYLLGVPLLMSTDGGRSFRNVNEPGIHGDHQAMWIDPVDSQRVILGNDGGLAMTYDGGASWLKLNPIAVGQFYTVAVDDAEPYRIYGGLQDNGVRRGSSLSRPGVPPAWSVVGGGDGAYIAIDPRDQTVYTGYQFGFYTRYEPSGQTHPVRPRNRIHEPSLRYNWQTPVELSHHNSDIVFFGANKLFRSMDRGETWTAISPELTSSSDRGDVPFGTLTTFSESPLHFGLIWAGTDDGRAWVTRNGGEDWQAVDRSLPAGRWVSRIVASSHQKKRAYISLNGYRNDDTTAYLFRTDDFGKSWRSIAEGLPQEAINVVREDPLDPQRLYVGTDRGVYTSPDSGASWQSLGGGLPPVPVHDLAIHRRERELVAGTHGRSVWVLDLLPVQELTEEIRASELHIFPADGIEYQRHWRSRRSEWWFRPEEAPKKTFSFWSKSGGAVRLQLLDDGDRLLLEKDLVLEPGVNAWSFDLLLDEDLARSAETERLSAREDGADSPPTRAETPWAEALRLGRPLLITPGDYQLVITRESSQARLKLTVDPPEPLEPRHRAEKKIRGRR